MAQRLYRRAFALASPGTITSDAFSSRDGFEVFAQSGTASAASTIAISVESQDLIGSWHTSVGTLANLLSGAQARASFPRGASRGAADPLAFGVAQRVKAVVTGGTVQLGISVVGY